MRKFRYLLAIPAAVVLVGSTAAVASAVTVVTKAHFVGDYSNTSTSGHVSGWSCKGVHTDNSSGISDNETCTVAGDTTGFIAGTYAGDPSAYFPPYNYPGGSFWYSDYDGVQATSYIATVTGPNKADVFKVHIDASYAS
jgi:hypothetical protein